MPDTPFVLIDAQARFFDNDWFNHCRETRTPFVVVRSGDTAADVLWDYVTLPVECDLLIRRHLPTLEREARAIFERYAIPGSHLRVKATLIAFDHLPIERAKQAAAELYTLIAGYLTRLGLSADPASPSQAPDSKLAATSPPRQQRRLDTSGQLTSA
jgi:hypothetical protein